jgi:hypothetical protein
MPFLLRCNPTAAVPLCAGMGWCNLIPNNCSVRQTAVSGDSAVIKRTENVKETRKRKLLELVSECCAASVWSRDTCGLCGACALQSLCVSMDHYYNLPLLQYLDGLHVQKYPLAKPTMSQACETGVSVARACAD